jgi:hypothetical protein
MSTQVSLVKGIGYKFEYDEDIFSFIKNIDDEEYDFIDVLNMSGCYYDMKKLKSDNRISPLRVYTDGMSGEYKYVLFVTEVSYLENSHGDDRWRNKYRNDEYVKQYAKQHIETFLQRTMNDEPKELEFEHWQ